MFLARPIEGDLINPQHALEAVGATLTFKTELKVKNETMITAIVASTENLNESEEQNNKAVATHACKK